MSAVQELERAYYLPTSTQSAEIATPRTFAESLLCAPRRIDMVPGLGRNSVLTEETGFVLWMEINRFYNDLNFALSSGKNLIESLSVAINELEVNIRDYNIEFIKSKTVIPHSNRFDVVDGVQRIVGNNGRPVVDAISAEERKGSVLQAARIVESFLPSAEPNSFAVIMSPDGWSGYINKDGKDHLHKNAETMVFWKDKDSVLKGLTFVIDLPKEQAKQVMVSLGVSEKALEGENEQDRLANIVKNPALLAFPGSDINPFEYVLDKILAIRGREAIRLLQKDGSEEIRSIEQTRVDIGRFDELLSFDQQEEEYILELREFIMGRAYQIGDSAAQERIAKEIERTVLKLARQHLRKNDTTWKGFSDEDRVYVKTVITPHVETGRDDEDNFSEELQYLRSRGGCSTSGSSEARVLGGISLGTELAGATMPSAVTIADLKDKDFCIRCGACGKFIWCVVKHGGKCPKCSATREC